MPADHNAGGTPAVLDGGPEHALLFSGANGLQQFFCALLFEFFLSLLSFPELFLNRKNHFTKHLKWQYSDPRIAFHVSLFQCGSPEVRAHELGLAQIGTGQIRVNEPRAFHIRANQNGKP